MSEIREPHGNQPYPGTDPYPGPLTVTPPESYEAKIKRLEVRVAELEHWLGLAVEANRVLDSCTDGYYRADESDEVKAWDAVEDAVKESLNRK